MQVDIVLKSTLYSGNIGFIARSSKNFDIGKIKLVNPWCSIDKESLKFASNARDMLSEIEIYNTLEDALKEYHLVFGTTARLGGARKQKIFDPQEAAQKAVDEIGNVKDAKVAILFGPEDKGLNNKAIALCQHLINIPTSERHTSLNLSHAVSVLAYEFFKVDHTIKSPKNEEDIPATFEFTEQFYTQLHDMLDRFGYFRTDNHAHVMTAFRKLGTKASLTHNDITIMRGVLRKLSWFMDNSK
jgi:tRNA/rRNA methyltransferase